MEATDTEVKVEIDIAEEPVPLYLIANYTNVGKDVSSGRQVPLPALQVVGGGGIAISGTKFWLTKEAVQNKPHQHHGSNNKITAGTDWIKDFAGHNNGKELCQSDGSTQRKQAEGSDQPWAKGLFSVFKKKKVQSLERPFACHLCFTAFKRTTQLKEHLIRHSGERSYACTKCDEKFSLPQQLKRHLLMHSAQKPNKCPHCDAAFSQLNRLTRHIRRGHSNLSQYSSAAELSFAAAAERREIDKTLEKPYASHLYPATFKQLSHLRDHMFKHTGERKYVCTKCDERFSLPQDLKQHILTHTGDRPLKCPHCDASFSLPYHLTRHIRKGHSKNNGAPSKAELNFALAVDDREIDKTLERPYSCHLCNAAFKRRGNLKEHMLTHSAEKPYACPKCDASFSLPQHLRRHMLMHTAHKPYKCPHCDATFTVTGQVTRHIRRGHKQLCADFSATEFQASVAKNSKPAEPRSMPASPATKKDVCQNEESSNGYMVSAKAEPALTVGDEQCGLQSPVFDTSNDDGTVSMKTEPDMAVFDEDTACQIEIVSDIDRVKTEPVVTLLSENASVDCSVLSYSIEDNCVESKSDSSAMESSLHQNDVNDTGCIVRFQTQLAVGVSQEDLDSEWPGPSSSEVDQDPKSKSGSPAAEHTVSQFEKNKDRHTVTVKQEPEMFDTGQKCESDFTVLPSSEAHSGATHKPDSLEADAGACRDSIKTEVVSDEEGISDCPVFFSASEAEVNPRRGHLSEVAEWQPSVLKLLRKRILTSREKTERDRIAAETTEEGAGTSTSAGNKRHSCKFCGARFSFPCRLKRHMLKHTREKPHAYSVCD